MDLNKEVDKDTSKAKKESQKNSINENQHGVVPIDPPPSYNEAMQIHPHQDLSYSAQPPSAPSLDANNAISYPYNNLTPANFPQAGAPPNDKRFQNWDDNATRIVIINRLQMNDRFQAARSSWETELLWRIILDDLIIHGYQSTIFDLMQYWSHLFQLYVNIAQGVASGVCHTDWEYFPFMHQTFGNADGTRVLDAIPTSGGPANLSLSSGLSDTVIIPVAMNLPPEPHKLVENLGTQSTLPNPHAPSVLTNGNLPPETSSLAPLSSDDSIPLLAQTNSGSTLQSEILSKSSNMVAESSSAAMPSTATTLLPASATLPSTSVVPAVINVQPTEPSNFTGTPSTLPQPGAADALVPSASDLPSAASPLPSSQAIAANNASSGEQVPLLCQANDAASLPSNVWVKSNALAGEPALTGSAFPIASVDQAASAASAAGPADGLMNCITPADCFPSNVETADLMSAITAQPDGVSMTKILEDSSVITSQPTAIPGISSFESYGDDDYGCCDGCCGEDFCCGDCYCEGGDCDLGDCGAL